jgi:hypothetical protein
MAAFDQVVGDRQADLADTDEANRLHDPPRSIVCARLRFKSR